MRTLPILLVNYLGHHLAIITMDLPHRHPRDIEEATLSTLRGPEDTALEDDDSLALRETRHHISLVMSGHSSRTRAIILAKSVYSASMCINKLQYLLLIFSCRQIKTTDPNYEISTYAKETATGTLRTHLCKRHGSDWVSGCEQHKIPIKSTSELVRRVVQQFHGTTGTGPSARPRKPFSKEAFVDAIVEFIVADDQVHHLDSDILCCF